MHPLVASAVFRVTKDNLVSLATLEVSDFAKSGSMWIWDTCVQPDMRIDNPQIWRPHLYCPIDIALSNNKSKSFVSLTLRHAATSMILCIIGSIVIVWYYVLPAFRQAYWQFNLIE